MVDSDTVEDESITFSYGDCFWNARLETEVDRHDCELPKFETKVCTDFI